MKTKGQAIVETGSANNLDSIFFDWLGSIKNWYWRFFGWWSHQEWCTQLCKFYDWWFLLCSMGRSDHEPIFSANPLLQCLQKAFFLGRVLATTSSWTTPKKASTHTITDFHHRFSVWKLTNVMTVTLSVEPHGTVIAVMVSRLSLMRAI